MARAWDVGKSTGWWFFFGTFGFFWQFLVLGLQGKRKQGRKQQPGRIGRKEGGREGRKEGKDRIFVHICAGNTGSNGTFC